MPIAAPSANPSGRISPTTAAHVAESLMQEAALILDGGPAPLGLESTVVGFENDKPVLLRPGALPREAIEAVAGPLQNPTGTAINSPGQLKSHYAPNTPLRLEAREVGIDEALLAFGAPLAGAKMTRNLSLGRNLDEAAANLFAMLHRLDAAHCACIAVMPIPEHGLGEAINDRLRRAAAPRER
jgi:L-threonylcarbamoyladenylate synthase